MAGAEFSSGADRAVPVEGGLASDGPPPDGPEPDGPEPDGPEPDATETNSKSFFGDFSRRPR